MAYGVRVVFPQTPSMLAVVGTVPTVAVVPPKQRGVLLTLYNSSFRLRFPELVPKVTKKFG
jgi:hypothetical protein